MKPIRICSILLIMSNVMCGCAYNFGEADKHLPGGYRLIAVPIFKNQSQDAAIEAFFTQSMVEEIERSKLARVVPKEESQAILEGIITSVNYKKGTEISRETEGDFKLLPSFATMAKEYTVLIRANIILRRSSDLKIIWQGSFKGERRYPAPVVTKPIVRTVNPLYNHSAQVETIRLLSKDVMAEAYNEMTENF